MFIENLLCDGLCPDTGKTQGDRGKALGDAWRRGQGHLSAAGLPQPSHGPAGSSPHGPKGTSSSSSTCPQSPRFCPTARDGGSRACPGHPVSTGLEVHLGHGWAHTCRMRVRGKAGVRSCCCALFSGHRRSSGSFFSFKNLNAHVSLDL